ncbi:Putative Fe-S oxidoreductase [Methyloversatilis universalis FAM5]|uniref:Fe-S oxidoreductase n=1 Tax=Methyloversatilis universalis (strain ATCC BAA-1314 / DSM 25237 / JCM 13912 / CCUG 52030 / FAM5) TaxID=1000565 RepID=F5R7W4_METUF|nr:(Fe-S)-binding protein [Methyloversatilis universalis]EGK73097.1 Putative Fe-S oxidoreductase [Methyloversatilis universalis FAM5]
MSGVAPGSRGEVGLFVTCLVDLMRPSIAFAAIRLLESAGYTVVVPDTQTCCGQPGYNAGDRAAARALARKLIAEFESFPHVVAPSGSCAGTVKVHYAELFADDPAWRARAEALAEKTFELTQFLVDVAGVSTVPGTFSGSVTYHDCCSGLRELGVKAQPRALMDSLPGVRRVEMRDCEECCGFGGLFSVKYPDISGAIVQRKCESIRGSGAYAVALGDLGCMMNIEGRLRRSGDELTEVIHIAELLAGPAGEGG